MRLRKIPQALTYLKQMDQVLILDSTKRQEVRHERGQTVALEIGCGKGDFSIGRAQAHPETHYYALEKYDSVLFKAVQKANALKLNNLTFILGDAADVGQLFEPQSVDKIYLNFSDPWPKARHAKRRLTYVEKLAIYDDLLLPTGKIELKTDNQGFFASSIDQLVQSKWHIEQLCANLYETNEFAEIKAFQTEYEKKFIGRGEPIYYLRASKGYK